MDKADNKLPLMEKAAKYLKYILGIFKLDYEMNIAGQKGLYELVDLVCGARDFVRGNL